MSLKCLYCGEEIKPEEIMPVGDGTMHRECLMRSVIGSVAHQQRKCSCAGGSGEDDPNLSRRENAKAAKQYFLQTQDKGAKAKFN